MRFGEPSPAFCLDEYQLAAAVPLHLWTELHRIGDPHAGELEDIERKPSFRADLIARFIFCNVFVCPGPMSIRVMALEVSDITRGVSCCIAILSEASPGEYLP